MRVISPFHDYYDGVGRGDLESTPVYRREPRVSYVKRPPQAYARLSRETSWDVPTSTWRTWEPWISWLTAGPQIPFALDSLLQEVNYRLRETGASLRIRAPGPRLVFFAGQVFTGWIVDRRSGFAQEERARWLTFSGATEIIRSVLVSPRERRKLEEVLAQQEGLGLRSESWTWTEKRYQAWSAQQPGADPVSLHRRERAPLVSLQQFGPQVVVEVNVRLTDCGFQSVVAAPQAWQSLDQFLSNEMAEQVDPDPLADDLRRDAHGFDAWSFKRPGPPPRKARGK